MMEALCFTVLILVEILILLVFRFVKHANWGAVGTLMGMAVLTYMLPGRLFLAFVLALAANYGSKSIHRVLTGVDDIRDYRGRDFLFSVGPPLSLGAVALFLPGSGFEVATLATLAVSVSDTCSSEVGTALGKPAYTIVPPRRASPGTEGAVSFAGSVAGLLAAFTFAALVHVLYGPGSLRSCALLASLGVLGNLLDSILGSTLQQAEHLSNAGVNLASETGIACLSLIVVHFTPGLARSLGGGLP